MPLGCVDEATLNQRRNEFDLKGVVYFEPSPPRTVIGRLQHELDPYCTNTHGRQVNEKSAALIDNLLGTHDVIWFNGIWIPNNLGRKVWTQSVLDLEDLPSRYYFSAMRRAQNLASSGINFRQLTVLEAP